MARKIITLYLVIEAAYPALVVAASLPRRSAVGHDHGRLSLRSLSCSRSRPSTSRTSSTCRSSSPGAAKAVTFAVYSLTRGGPSCHDHPARSRLHLGVGGILIAGLVSVGVAFSRHAARVGPRPDAEPRLERRARDGLFRRPGIIGGLAFYSLNLVDRVLHHALPRPRDNGLYGVAFRFSQVLRTAGDGFRLGWTSGTTRGSTPGSTRKLVARCANYYFVATGSSRWSFGLDPPGFPPLCRAVLGGHARGRATALARDGDGRLHDLRGRVQRDEADALDPRSRSRRRGGLGHVFPAHPAFSSSGRRGDRCGFRCARGARSWSCAQRFYPVPCDWTRIASPRPRRGACPVFAGGGRVGSVRSLAPHPARNHAAYPTGAPRFRILHTGRSGQMRALTIGRLGAR